MTVIKKLCLCPHIELYSNGDSSVADDNNDSRYERKWMIHHNVKRVVLLQISKEAMQTRETTSPGSTTPCLRVLTIASITAALSAKRSTTSASSSEWRSIARDTEEDDDVRQTRSSFNCHNGTCESSKGNRKRPAHTQRTQKRQQASSRTLGEILPGLIVSCREKMHLGS